MIDFHSFLPEDPKEAQRIFNTLPVEQQLEIVLKTRGKERIHALFLSEHPEELVHRLPELEVFLTVKEVGEKDAMDLISLTTPEQFQYLLDLDFWKKDQLDPEKALHWMEILIESGEEKVAQFIRSADPEFIALLLKKFLHVMTLEEEPLEGRERVPLFTLDQHYYIDFEGKGAREVFQPFLQILYRTDEKGYRRLMEAMIWEQESNLEETGYRLRNSRLADYGFPDFEEALEIYRFVNPDSLTVGESPPLAVQEETQQGSPTFYLTFQKEGPFLSSILAKIDDASEQNRLSYEMTGLCNKAIMAEPLDQFDMDGMKRVTQKVFHTLNLGLQYLSKEEEEKALRILRSVPVQKIFQSGVGATLLLRKKAEELLKGSWFAGNRENLSVMDPPYRDQFEGVLKRRPVLYQEGSFEDFRDLQDLRKSERSLEIMKEIVQVAGERLHLHPDTLKSMDLMNCHPEEWKEITFSTIFLTSFANQVLYGTFRFEAIGQPRLKDLFLHIFERDAQGKGVMKMEIRSGVRKWVDSIENDGQKAQHLMAFWDFCFDLLEEDYGRIPPGEEIDPRFVKGLLIRI
jgi:hypothetical protein